MFPLSFPLRVVTGCAVMLAFLVTPAMAQNASGQTGKNGTQASGRPVVVATARTQEIAETALVTGTAEANASVSIMPEQSGRVTEILFTEGAQVPAGTTLVQLDSRTAQARRDQARAQLANVERQLSRARALREGAAITAARIDELQAQAEASRAAFRETDVVVDQHSIKMPFDGVVGLRRISVGAQVTPSTVITTADDSSIVNVIFRVPDVWLANITPDLPITLVPAQNGGTRLTGKVVAVDSRVDSASRTIGIKAQVHNDAGTVKPGSMVKVEVPLARRDAALVVPEQALFTTGSQQALFVVDGGKAKRVNVQVGLRQRGIAEITEGLQQGQNVIAQGADRMRDGASINAAETLAGWEGPTAAGGSAQPAVSATEPVATPAP